MASKEKFGVSIGENRAENISIVQDNVDLIEKVKKYAYCFWCGSLIVGAVLL